MSRIFRRNLTVWSFLPIYYFLGDATYRLVPLHVPVKAWRRDCYDSWLISYALRYATNVEVLVRAPLNAYLVGKEYGIFKRNLVLRNFLPILKSNISLLLSCTYLWTEVRMTSQNLVGWDSTLRRKRGGEIWLAYRRKFPGSFIFCLGQASNCNMESCEIHIQFLTKVYQLQLSLGWVLGTGTIV